MTLDEFIASRLSTVWLTEPGLSYYVRKDLRRPGLIHLANCTALKDGAEFGMWRFMKKYAARVPFFAENCINEDVAMFFRRLKWREVIDLAEIPSFYSPLADQLFPPEQYPDWRRNV